MARDYSFLSEQIIRIWSGGDSSEDSELDIREIEALVAQAHANLVRINYFENLKATGESAVNSQFKTTFYKLPVNTHEDRGELYVQLPSQYLSLPSNKGLDQVSEWNNPDAKPIVIVSSGFAQGANGLRASGLENNFGCYPEGNQVFLVNKGNRDFKAKFVNVRIVRASAENMAADQELAIIGEVSRILSIRRPQDKQNDGNPTPV